jgi:hypothetical protein
MVTHFPVVGSGSFSDRMVALSSNKYWSIVTTSQLSPGESWRKPTGMKCTSGGVIELKLTHYPNHTYCFLHSRIGFVQVLHENSMHLCLQQVSCYRLRRLKRVSTNRLIRQEKQCSEGFTSSKSPDQPFLKSVYHLISITDTPPPRSLSL